MSRRGMLGFAAAACVACCAGPFLAAIGGISLIGFVGTLAFGVVSVAVAGGVIAAVLVVRHRARPSVSGAVPVDLTPRRYD